MNENHQRLCGSAEWAAQLQDTILARLCRDVELGPRMLEIGPGPGAATDWLRHRVTTLTAIEIDAVAADKLRERFAGTNVEIVTGDATRLPWPDGSFDTVTTHTMLHHVPTRHGQDLVLSEALRVLRPGGALLASDSLPSTRLHEFHEEDIYNPVDPGGLITRLQTIGYGRLMVEVTDRWAAQAFKPAEPEPAESEPAGS
jgi:ubiquinone/menaquinone biosynthesis C-methylase UbiE